ncbi:hypothetical protein FPOAC1_002158 [Fusarium poae]|uniref:hypothetical protein n=1 Tax=Fusarium poae TaxID=36050 RepID=UPI001CE7F40D|nr:hypothetical protein FPOAC1_002158 [Fusarium poae]KAG8676159.1 hypothetical protein FPOAC1_002158 [Fusarium poae]
MWEQEFLSEDVSGYIPYDQGFVPRDEDWAEKRKRDENDEEEKKKKKKKTIQDFFGIPAAVAPEERVAAAVAACKKSLATMSPKYQRRLQAKNLELELAGISE